MAGRIFVYTWNSTALAVAMTNDHFVEMWKTLWNSAEEYTIYVSYNTEWMTGGNVYYYQERSIRVNPLINEVGMGPDGTLNHEFGHAYSHELNNLSHYYSLKALNTDNPYLSDLYRELAERENIRANEQGYNQERNYAIRDSYEMPDLSDDEIWDLIYGEDPEAMYEVYRTEPEPLGGGYYRTTTYNAEGNVIETKVPEGYHDCLRNNCPCLDGDEYQH